MTTPLPAGFRIELDPSTQQLAEDLWFGGSPARVMRLTAAGRVAWRELCDGPVASAAGGALARRLTDAGLAQPKPPKPTGPPEVTVVIPVRDRARMLDRCLSGLDHRHPVIVVDDGSLEPDAVAAVVAGHGAKLVRRAVNGGPAAARNAGLEQVSTELVAFVDSDCVPTPDWLDALAAHFQDPLVAAVAPRITALGEHGGSGLDLGESAGRVVPNTRIAYVPTAALLVRRDAVRTARGFDEAMRVGEDVDLVWRLHEAGWRIRYEPSVCVRHDEPGTLAARLTRRFRYGTSAAPLARRHPRSVPPLVLHPWPALTVLALLGRRPVLAGVAFAASVLTMLRTLRRADVPTGNVLPAMGDAVRQTWLGIGHYGVQFGAPLLLAALVAPGRTGRRLAAASLLFGPAVTAWTRDRSREPVRFVLENLAEDIAYGAGVWTGCRVERTSVPVRPVISWHPLQIERKETRSS